jgi:DMSO/TMAO reductase YedYZ molybdopterin-dependent catalytic subunit
MSNRSARCLCALTAICVAAVLFLCVSHETAAKDPDRPSLSLTIMDVDGSPVEFSPESVGQLPQVEEKECICVGEHVGFIGIIDYKGVRLADLLKNARAASALSLYEQKSLYLIFKGTDGYQVIASWCELTQTAAGARAMVALEKDGKPLPPNEGPFRLLFPADKYVGRSVKCLETIEIRSAMSGKPAPHD